MTTTANKLKKIWLIALPIVIQGIVFQIQSLTDKYFLGNLDAIYLSALGAAQFPFSASLDAFVAMSVGLIIYVSQFKGAGSEDSISKYTKSSILYASCISLLIFALWFLFTEPILILLHVDAAILPESAHYIRICSFYLLVLGIDTSLQAMLQGIGKTKPIMITSLMKVFLNVVLSYILIFGKLGFEPMNIEGAAIGTLLSNLIASLFLMIYCFILKHQEYALHTNLHDYFDWKPYIDTVKIGVPTAMEYFLWNASNLVLLAFLNSLSYEATAVYTLTFGIEVVIYAVFNGTGKASMTLIGQDIGAADYESAHDYVKICIIVNSLLITICVLLFVVFSKPLLGIFTTSTKLINLASPYLIFTGIILFPKSINVIVGNAIRSHGNTKWMLYSQIIGSIFVISCSFILVKVLHLGILAIYITLFLDETIRSSINGIYYRKKYCVANLINSSDLIHHSFSQADC